MSDSFQGDVKLVDELRPEFSSRSKRVINETSKFKNRSAKTKLVQAKEIDGWSVARVNKASIRFQKEKPSEQQLEDDLWCLMFRMGFKFLNEGRTFKVRVSPSDYRQIDVMAVDDESVIFVECTQSSSPRTKDMKPVIQYIATIRVRAEKSVREQFGRRKIGWVIATRNIKWRHTDLDRAKEEKISVIRDGEIEYFEKLAGLLAHAARYQYLALQFAGERFSREPMPIPAMMINMGSRQVAYKFAIHPNEILKRSFVAHKAYRDIDSYQRLISHSRLKKIGKFLDQGGQFPTNVVLNVRSGRRKSIRFDPKERIGNVSVGTLYLPSEYACAFVVDGQHRLFGYAHSDLSKNPNDKSTFSVLAYQDLDPQSEQQMFIDINHEQKSVKKNLLNEIYSSLNWDSADYSLKISSLANRVGLELNKRPDSPLKDRIQTEGRKHTNLRCLSLEQISDTLVKKKFFGEKRVGGQEILGPLSDSNYEDLERTFEKAVTALIGLFQFVEQIAPDHWNLGQAAGGFLATNMGVRSLLGVFREVLRHIEKEDAAELDIFEPDDFMPAVNGLMKPLIEHFRDLGIVDVARFRGRIGMGGVIQNERAMMGIINKSYDEFTTPELEQWLSSQDEEGTKEAGELINEMQNAIFEFVTKELKSKYGEDEDDWWVKVPEKIRNKCNQRREAKTDNRRKPWNYLDLIDYRDIVQKEDKLFMDIFTLDKDTSVSKTKRVMWIKDLNDYRQTTHHPEKWPLLKEDVNKVRKIFESIMARLSAQSIQES